MTLRKISQQVLRDLRNLTFVLLNLSATAWILLAFSVFPEAKDIAWVSSIILVAVVAVVFLSLAYNAWVETRIRQGSTGVEPKTSSEPQTLALRMKPDGHLDLTQFSHITISGDVGYMMKAIFDEAAKSQAELKSLKADLKSGEASDGYHTINELYEYRRVYNTLLFNEWAARGVYDVHKSWHHSDGEPCFGKPGKWFIVVAQLPTGQISNHYKAEFWGTFKVPDRAQAAEFDWHTPQIALERMDHLVRSEQGAGS